MDKNRFPTEITVLFEPTGACNLRCRHCYHAKTEYDEKKMSLETVDKFLSITAPYYKKVKIIWHGGEPLLMTYDFFKESYALFYLYAKKFGIDFNFNIQTNGTLLDERLIEFFKSTDTTISISYDGKYNNVLRQHTDKVQASINLLKYKNVNFACLSTISSHSVNQLIELFESFNKANIQAKFNPLLPDGAANENTEFLLTKEEWTENFIELFKYWFFDSTCNIRLSSCCDILAKYLGMLGYGCLSGLCLFRYIAIDAYGNLYPCGRLIDKSFLLDNIYNIKDIRQAFLSERYVKILNENQQRKIKCKDCKWFSRCHSGCNASANLNGDLTTPFEFECYFTRRVFETIKNLLEDYDLNKINKYARDILSKSKMLGGSNL